jgi:hypothetical protein
VVGLHAFCLGQRIAQFVEREIRLLCDQFLQERPMRRQHSAAARPALRGRFLAALVMPTAPPRPVTPSDETPPLAHSILLQYTSETAFEARPTKVLT